LRLAENYAEALAIGSDPWDFAVSTEVLRISGGLTHADLHWLVREGSSSTPSRRARRVAGRASFAKGNDSGWRGAFAF